MSEPKPQYNAIPSQPTTSARYKGNILQRKGMQKIGDLFIDPSTGKRATVDYWGRVEWIESPVQDHE